MANDDQVPPADEADRKVWHAVNYFDECESIVGRLVEWGKKYPKGTIHNFKAEKEHDAIESDAARLWAKMQEEVGDGA